MSLRTRDGLSLSLYRWPVESQAAVVAVIHGYGEHAGRYAHVAEAFNRRGFSVVAADLRGHGRSEGRRSFIQRFEDYHLDVDALVDQARSEAKGTPIFVLAHSLGALITFHWLLAGRGQDIAGVVASSPFLGVALPVNPVKKGMGILMSRFWPTLALPAGIKGEHVTQDPEMQRRYETDPLMGRNATARWYTESLAAIETTLARAGELNKPLLLLYAGADRLASASTTDRLAAKLAMSDRTIERLHGLGHEIVNALPDERAKVIERMGQWITDRAQARR